MDVFILRCRAVLASAKKRTKDFLFQWAVCVHKEMRPDEIDGVKYLQLTTRALPAGHVRTRFTRIRSVRFSIGLRTSQPSSSAIFLATHFTRLRRLIYSLCSVAGELFFFCFFKNIGWVYFIPDLVKSEHFFFCFCLSCFRYCSLQIYLHAFKESKIEIFKVV